MKTKAIAAAALFIIALLGICACSSSGDDNSGPGGVGDYDNDIQGGGDGDSLFEDGDNDSSADGDGDSDGVQTPQQQVEAVVAEMLAGRMARSAEALEQQVFPHLSADYQRAGLDRDGQMEYELRKLEENPGLHVNSYISDINVEIEENEAAVDISNEINATLADPQGRVFVLEVSGKYEERAWFVYENDEAWRCIGSTGLSADLSASGGEEELTADLSYFAVDELKVSAGGSVSLSGSFDVPQLAEGQLMYALLSLDFGDKRNNAQEWTSEEDTIWHQDVTDRSGSAFDFDINLPDDGGPQNISIPATLEFGEESITASLTLVTYDDSDFELLRIDNRSFDLNLENAGHAAFCEAGQGETPDGLWKMQLSNETAPDLNLFQLADLRIVEGDVYGHVLYVSHTQEDTYIPVALEVTGTVEGDEISFSFEGEDFSVEYGGTIKDGVISDGEAVFEVSLTSIMADFSAEKLDTRCSSITLGGMNNAKVSVELDKKTQTFDISADEYNVVMSEEDTERSLTGYMIRNVLTVVDEASPGSWLLLGFYDEEGGFAAYGDGEEISEGAFSAEAEMPGK